MRTAPALLAGVWWLGTTLVPVCARADWLILNGGKKIETDGPWQLKGDLLTVHEATGRTTTVSVNIVDAAACLRVNSGKLRIETLPVPLRAGTSVPYRRVWSSATPNPAISTSPALTALRAAAITAGGAPPAAAAPAAAAARAANTPRAAPAVSASAAAPAVSQASPTADSADQVKARKLAAQAQMQREKRYLAVVDSCEHQFVNDQPGFQRCVQAQLAAAPR
jgi:hypothetical protein